MSDAPIKTRPPVAAGKGREKEHGETLSRNSSSASALAHALEGKASGSGYAARCPAHDDRNPSLSISDGDNGVLVHCHAGCDQDAVIEALRGRGLWPERERSNRIAHPKLGEPHTVWTYRDESGQTLGHVCRWETAQSKDIRPYVNGSWHGFEKPRPLYGLDRLASNPDAPVIVCEGEKAADAAQKIMGGDYVCITWPGGTGGVNCADWSPLQGRTVYVWPDNDTPGRKAAKAITQRVDGAQVMETPEGKPEGWDAADALADGFTRDAVTGRFPNIDATPSSRGFALIRAGDLEFRAPRYLIRDRVESDSLALVFGDPGCGKSFLGVDVACCVATGTEFHGYPVEHGPVIYIAGEGQNGLSRRFRAWEIARRESLATAPLYVSTSPAALCDEASITEVVRAVEGIAESAGAPAVVIVDTVARNFGPGDENSTHDMAAFIQAADTIRTRYRSTVLLIHHTGHGDKTRARGAMALKGALDAEYRMDKDEDGVIRVEATKMKDAEQPEPMAFRIASVDLGLTDHEGRPVTSAVLDATLYEPPAPRKQRRGRGKRQTEMLGILERMEKEHRANLEADGRDPDTARVSLEAWRDECIRQGVPRQRFYQAKDALADRKDVVIEQGFIRAR